MTRFLGNAPYCYSNTMAMTLGVPIDPSLFEVLTGSAFGFQQIGAMPLFDPPGWDPDLGIEQALSIMNIRSERETFTDADQALLRLAELAAIGPVFVGPLEMGLLSYQPGADNAIGADHFVAVLAVTGDSVLIHDPQGFPYARLSHQDFTAAWGSDSLAYGQGRFPLRTGFSEPRGDPAEWLDALLTCARAWASGRHATSSQRRGNAEGLRVLADQVEDEWAEPTPTLLRDFALRLGARRRADAAAYLVERAELAVALQQQAQDLGVAQLSATRGDRLGLAAGLRRAADAHERVLRALGQDQ